jgi:hypothetical protein
VIYAWQIRGKEALNVSIEGELFMSKGEDESWLVSADTCPNRQLEIPKLIVLRTEFRRAEKDRL